MKFIIQQGISGMRLKERYACERYPHIKTTYDQVSEYFDRDYCPLGSVEFVQRFSEMCDVILPENISYPHELQKFLKRNIRKSTFKKADSKNFVKPVNTKIFTGGIKKDLTETVNDDCVVWESDPVQFDAEFRCYVIDRILVGYSRYDDSDEEYDLDIDLVNTMIQEYDSQPIGYAIDVGIVNIQDSRIVNNSTILVEVNDGWSLGLYSWGNMTEKSYVELIYKRWQQIAN